MRSIVTYACILMYSSANRTQSPWQDDANFVAALYTSRLVIGRSPWGIWNRLHWLEQNASDGQNLAVVLWIGREEAMICSNSVSNDLWAELQAPWCHYLARQSLGNQFIIDLWFVVVEPVTRRYSLLRIHNIIHFRSDIAWLIGSISWSCGKIQNMFLLWI